MSLTVCYLTRNEEAHLAASLQSVTGFATEILVVDTGSTDGTVGVAAANGATVLSYTWEDDFAAGRNFALQQAKGDWILWLNGNEEVTTESRSHLTIAMSIPFAFGYFITLQSGMAKTDTQDLRLFRRRPDLRFVGCLHPHLEPTVIQAIQAEGFQVTAAPIVLRMIASNEINEAKLRFIARLAEQELKQRPGQLHYLIEYGRVLLLLKDSKGYRIMAEAVEHVLPIIHAATAPATKVQELLQHILTAPSQINYRLNRDLAVALTLKWFANSPSVLYWAAEHSFRTGQYRQAADILERLVSFGKTGNFDKTRAFDPGIIGDDAMINLAACYWQMQQWDAAEKCYRQLIHSQHFASQARQALTDLQHRRQVPQT